MWYFQAPPTPSSWDLLLHSKFWAVTHLQQDKNDHVTQVLGFLSPIYTKSSTHNISTTTTSSNSSSKLPIGSIVTYKCSRCLSNTKHMGRPILNLDSYYSRCQLFLEKESATYFVCDKQSSDNFRKHLHQLFFQGPCAWHQNKQVIYKISSKLVLPMQLHLTNFSMSFRESCVNCHNKQGTDYYTMSFIFGWYRDILIKKVLKCPGGHSASPATPLDFSCPNCGQPAHLQHTA